MCYTFQMVLFLQIFATVTFFCLANGQSCSTADGDEGTCKSLQECSSLQQIFEKADKTQLLTKFKCDGQGNDKVCCPNPCSTPEGNPGACVSIFSCPHLAKLLQPPITNDNVQYVNNSRCSGQGEYSVCCGPQAVQTKSRSGGCADVATSAFPPQPSTGCCGVDARVTSKIINGNITAIDEYPWLAIIEYQQAGLVKLLCGGSLISGRYVLTAAHCVVGKVLEHGTPKRVRLGEFDTTHEGEDCVLVDGGGKDCTEGVTRVPIERLTAHPAYNKRPNTPHDIALIRLLWAAPYTDFIRPICLPTTDVTASPPANFTLFVAGWGAVSETPQSYSPVKLHVDLFYSANDTCEQAYRSNGKDVQIRSGQVCAGGVLGKDSCRGDSGGPLMWYYSQERVRFWEIIGIVSYGPTPCGAPGIPGVYTKVHEYTDWINSVITA